MTYAAYPTTGRMRVFSRSESTFLISLIPFIPSSVAPAFFPNLVASAMEQYNELAQLINDLLRDYIKLEHILPIFIIVMTVCQIFFLLKGFHGDGIIFALATVYAAIRRPAIGSTQRTHCSTVETPHLVDVQRRMECSDDPDHPKAADNNLSKTTSIRTEADRPAATDNSGKTPPTRSSVWHIASSAAYHMTGDMNQMTGYIPMIGGLLVNIPNMAPMRVHGSGSVWTATMSLHNVMHVPGLEKSLVSTSQLAKAGYTVALGPDGCRITKDRTLVGEAHVTDDYLFVVDFLRVASSSTD